MNKILKLLATLPLGLLAGVLVNAEPNPYPPPSSLESSSLVENVIESSKMTTEEETSFELEFLVGSVSPSKFDAILRPGESVTVEKIVSMPEIPPKLDFVLMVDLSGSYNNDLPKIKNLAPDIFDKIRAQVNDSRFGLVTFVDFPFGSWGSSGDYPYRLDRDLTTDRSAWLNAINGMSTKYGGDEPESQNEALYQAAKGIPPNENPSFRKDATRIIAITTDASFHQRGDSGGPFPYPGANDIETISVLKDAGIKVIAIKAPGATNQMDNLANATSGSVVTTDSSSSQLVEAILKGLEAVTFTVWAKPRTECTPLTFTYSPTHYTDISGGETVIFYETIAVPTNIDESSLDPDGKISCTVDFLADDTVVGTQEVSITVNRAPIALCQNLDLEANDSCVAEGNIDAGSYDPDGDLITLTYSNEGPYHLGNTTVTLTVTDPFGASDSCIATVTVKDVTSPLITVGTPITLLWPPNHKYNHFNLEKTCGILAIDNCDGKIDISSSSAIKWAYSDEPENAKGDGDGNTVEDIVITDNTGLDVRAERAGSGNGRVYGTVFEVSDSSNNKSEGTCYIGIPHSQNDNPPIDDGPTAGYKVK